MVIKKSRELFGQIYQSLHQHQYPFIWNGAKTGVLLKKAYAIDSTSIILFKDILKASGRKSKDGNSKGSIKANVQIRLLDELPMNIKYTAGASNDHEFMENLILEKGDIAIFDKAYVEYEYYHKQNKNDIYFVT